MIRDRGTIKWTSMMLPEHVKMLREWKVEQTYENKRLVDEQLLDEMNFQLHQAIHEDRTVAITYYKNHHHFQVNGKISKINLLENRIAVKENAEEYMELSLANVVDVKLLNE